MRLLLLLLFLPMGMRAQTISGRVLDANTRDGLPYVSIGIVGSIQGTLSNEEGYFSMSADTLHSTLQFSTIGYKTHVISAAEVARGGAILLYPTARELPSFVVRGSDALYERVARVAKALKQRTPEQARAYFELETHVEQQPVEVVECFYNAKLSGAQVRELRLKHGRISLAPFQSTPGSERYFVSLNTTKAVTLFDLTGSDERFPVSPLQWTKAKAIKKQYRAELIATDEEGTDEILLTPRDTSGKAFTVKLWVYHEIPLAVELNCVKCTRHPFLPYQPGHTIRQVDLRIRQTWRADNAQLDHIELGYTLDYLNNEHAERVDTRAVLHLFDPGGAFILPLFDYDQEQPDYRKILLQPYDSIFWQRAPTLVNTAQQERDRAFLRTNGVFSGHRVDRDHARSSFFESNCAWWSTDKRISLKSLPPPKEVARPASFRSQGATAPISQVNLEAQLYLDMDTTGGQWRFFSATVLDGFRSYYRLPEEVHTDCFINLFFDLCEMERRKMAARLLEPGLDAPQALVIHAQAVAGMQRTTQQYMKEVKLGSDRAALQRWNAVVKDGLGIDNMALFGL